jgi:hypothetical protein
VNAGIPQSATVLDAFVDLIGSQLRMSVLANNGAINAELQSRVDHTLKFAKKLFSRLWLMDLMLNAKQVHNQNIAKIVSL